MEEPVEDHESALPMTKHMVQCPLDTAEGLETYWLRLEFIFSQQKRLVDSCFPATTTPEVCALMNWSGAKLIMTSKWLTLAALMDEREPLDWKKCRDISKSMGIPYHQVVKLNTERCRKTSIDASTPAKRTKKRTRRHLKPSKKRKPKKQRKHSAYCNFMETFSLFVVSENIRMCLGWKVEQIAFVEPLPLLRDNWKTNRCKCRKVTSLGKKIFACFRVIMPGTLRQSLPIMDLDGLR